MNGQCLPVSWRYAAFPLHHSLRERFPSPSLRDREELERVADFLPVLRS